MPSALNSAKTWETDARPLCQKAQYDPGSPEVVGSKARLARTLVQPMEGHLADTVGGSPKLRVEGDGRAQVENASARALKASEQALRQREWGNNIDSECVLKVLHVEVANAARVAYRRIVNHQRNVSVRRQRSGQCLTSFRAADVTSYHHD